MALLPFFNQILFLFLMALLVSLLQTLLLPLNLLCLLLLYNLSHPLCLNQQPREI
ncbi:hypothetical protein NC653_002522 [Populus alba x Populus x berolinensis]|uniref:Uncharacterized protein n=1 Tax=Populus alba x Populus x berolinensis TaxID=444605 RepID=A0AAD6RNZ6_9ROSI|nr:hypothetical protein NC653_002522 [Populus alba x Populus x berolinensis]